MRVLKFGGTSVADEAAFERAVQIVREYNSAPLVVGVSAMMPGMAEIKIRDAVAAYG